MAHAPGPLTGYSARTLYGNSCVLRFDIIIRVSYIQPQEVGDPSAEVVMTQSLHQQIEAWDGRDSILYSALLYSGGRSSRELEELQLEA